MSARLFESGIEINIGVLHESGHKEPWIVVMDCIPNAVSVRDYGLRWCIEPMFSDFKSRGFGLEDTQLRYPEHWIFNKLVRSCLSWFQRGLRKLLRCAEMGNPLPKFGLSIFAAFNSSG
ncbi:hypothetical protein TI04_09405 [Achromatium sp. WMS2]|nr:hypothetical protein TI04_09405 [Achromatium sp. WMS2]